MLRMAQGFGHLSSGFQGFGVRDRAAKKAHEHADLAP